MERVGVTGTDIPMPHFFGKIFFLFILGTYMEQYLVEIHIYLRIGDVPTGLYTGTGTY